MFALTAALSLAACASVGLGSGGDRPMAPATARAAVLSGEAAEGAGQFRDAAGLYGRAYGAFPSADLAARWGRALRLAGDAKAATLQMQEAARKYPGDVGVLTELGRSATAGGFLPEAGEALSRAVTARGAGWATFSAYGAYLARTSSFDQAASWFRRAEAAAANDRERLSARANLALLRAQRGDLAGAEADLREVASHPGAEARVHADLALVLGLTGDRAGAAGEMAAAGASSGDEQRVVAWLSPMQVDPPAAAKAGVTTGEQVRKPTARRQRHTRKRGP